MNPIQPPKLIKNYLPEQCHFRAAAFSKEEALNLLLECIYPIEVFAIDQQKMIVRRVLTIEQAERFYAGEEI